MVETKNVSRYLSAYMGDKKGEFKHKYFDNVNCSLNK